MSNSVTLWTAVGQALLAMGFSRKEYWSKLHALLQGILSAQVSHIAGMNPGKPKNTGVDSPIPSPGDLPNPGIKPGSPALQEDSLPTELWMEGHKLQSLLDLDLNPDITFLPCVLLNRILNVPEIQFCFVF